MFFDGTFWSERRADRARARHAPRRGHGALADRRRRRQPARARQASRAAARSCIHVNNTNPILRDDSRRARAALARRASRSRTTAWSSSCERTTRDAALAPTAFVARLRARASAATTTATRSTCACTRARSRASELQAWVLNRYYYQTRIPIKDALILVQVRGPGVPARVDPAHPRSRRRRAKGEGGLALWLRLAEAVGLDRERGRELPATCCPACASPATPTCSSCASEPARRRSRRRSPSSSRPT